MKIGDSDILFDKTISIDACDITHQILSGEKESNSNKRTLGINYYQFVRIGQTDPA